MAIEDRSTVKPGVVLTAKYKEQDFKLFVTGAADDMRFRTENGEVFGSISKAGTYLTNTSVNGWRFWSVSDQAVPAEVLALANEDVPRSRLAKSAAEPKATPAEKTAKTNAKAAKTAGAKATATKSPAEPKAPKAPKAPAVKPKRTLNLKQMKDQSGVDQTIERAWWCEACCKKFLVARGETPQTCPEGHGRMMDDESIGQPTRDTDDGSGVAPYAALHEAANAPEEQTIVDDPFGDIPASELEAVTA